VNAAFYTGREQTLIKHKLLERYLKAAMPILGSWADDLYYIDCLAGPWETVDPALSDTSFAIASDVLRRTKPILKSRGRSPTMRALLIERDRGAYERLSRFASAIHDIDVVAKNWDFEKSIQKIVQSVEKRRRSFPFFFIDPTGWECAAIPVIKPLLQVQPGEVLINLMTSWISRFLADPTKPFQNLLGPGFERIIVLSGDDREEAIISCYTEAVREAGNFPYVCTMPILKSTNEAFHFHMVYATRSPKGVEEFKRAEDEVVPFMHGVRADAKIGKLLQKTGQYPLLEASEMYVDERHSRYRAANLQRAEKAVSKVER
jgi:three-Cys-motif partner protein